MPISGLVIQIDPAQRDAIVSQLTSIQYLEMPESPPSEKLVAVIDAPSMRDEEAIFKQISDLGLPSIAPQGRRSGLSRRGRRA